jgi:hypothetical protein
MEGEAKMSELAKKQRQLTELEKKYNIEALQSYNFDNFTFDINLGGDLSEKDVEIMKREEAEYND